MSKKLTVAVGGLVAIATQTSCTSLVCGPNTLEVDGKCVTSVNPGTECGPGTRYDTASGRCVNSIFFDDAGLGGVCGDNTTLVIDDAGIHYCVGTGGATNCNAALPCPTPDADKLSLCGRLYDIEDTKPLDDGTGTNAAGVEIRIYDPLAFVSNPNAPILLTARPDTCGRFAIKNAPLPGTGLVAVATEDFDNGTHPDLYVQTGIARRAQAGQVFTGLVGIVFRRTTDATWSSVLTPGDSFAKRGVWIPIYLSGNPTAPFANTPTAGVTATLRDTGSGTFIPDPASDWYFDDTNPLERKIVSSSKSATGANGTVLFSTSSPTPLTDGAGTGGEPATKCWSFDSMATPKGNAFVQEKIAGTVSCP